MAAKKKATDDSDLKKLLSRLVTERVIYFPIRHHSPACAWHVARLIREHQPASILIEGPEALDEYIPDLAAEDTVAPVALFTQFIDRKKITLPKPAEEAETKVLLTPPRYAAYYPLCDYSPELVAIREGKKIDARLAFCDLNYADQIVVESHDSTTWDRMDSLLDERHLTQNEYLVELARRRGCRDTNELWDRVFECDLRGNDTKGFMEKVAAYCHFARCNTVPETLETDGTLARETRMAQIIQKELTRLKRRKETRPLLVVTGGFHTPPLALKTADTKAKLPELDLTEDEALTAIIRYSFPQLDALNGYSAGMPSPLYYQRLWQRNATDETDPLEALSRELLVELPQRTREAKLAQTLSTADAIAAHHHACSLAQFRGNPGPMREDVLDGIRSSFVKGSLDAEGEMVLDLALQIMCGDAVGSLPPSARIHPLVRDFQYQANGLGLKLDSAVPKETALEIYRRDRHVRISRLFRCLDFLDVPFARLTAGPDFIAGTGLELQIEHWTHTWSPQTDSSLIAAAIHGTSITDAVIGKLQARQQQIEAEGGDAGATHAVALLVTCCRLGIGGFAKEFMPHVLAKLQSESDFGECMIATTQINLLHRHRSPLETDQQLNFTSLLTAAYHRCCHLVSELRHCPEDRVAPVLELLPAIREVLLPGSGEEVLDPSLFWIAAKSILNESGLPPTLSGGLHGLLYTAGELNQDDILEGIAASLLSADRNGPCIARFLHGLFALSRDLTWQSRELMQAIDNILQGWNDAEFHEALPHLRLAFTQHTPQETNQVAKLVSELTGGEALTDWYQRDLDEEMLQHHSTIAARVHESLEQDKLLAFIEHAD